MPDRSASRRATFMVFEDPASHALLERIARVATSDVPVLITGEIGTGKEWVARELHARSARAGRPFVVAHAGALAEDLIEGELLGHEQGAFRGTHTSRAGWFEAAHGGTLFLHEVDELPLAAQVKLLRVMRDGAVIRLGSRQATAIDVRIIAGTNTDLAAAVRAERFREDLYYRLKVASITLPALRERRGDILPLARHFLSVYEQRLSRPAARLDASAAKLLLAHDWPGNIRELENAIHHALLVGRGPELSAEDFQLDERLAGGKLDAADDRTELERVFQALLEREVPGLHERVEAALLSATYRYCGYNQLETARRLGLSRNVVRARLIAHGELKGAPRRPATPARTSWTWTRARQTFRIGYQKLGMLMLVKGYGAFDAALASRGIHVEWVEYAGGIQLVDALRARELAACLVGDCPAVVAQAEEVPIVYVAAEPPAPHGTALLVPALSPVQCVRELRGKRVAVNRAAQAHYVLLKALEEAGVHPSEVEIRLEPPDRALRAFQSGQIDAWSIWDPWLSSARLDFGARVLRDATGLSQNSSFYLARRDFAEDQPELLQDLLNHVQIAAQWVKSDPSRAADMIAPELGLSSRALVASLQRELRTSPLTAELIAAQQDVADALLRLRFIPRAVSIAEAQWRMHRAVG